MEGEAALHESCFPIFLFKRRLAIFGKRIWLMILILAFVLPAFAGPAADEKALQEASTQKVGLRLVAIETAQLADRYESLLKREHELQESIRACTRSGETRLNEYQRAREDTIGDLDETKKKLVELESEKAKLIEGQAKKAPEDAAVESTEKLNRTLDAILQRLDKIDKRLEKIEAQKR